MSVELPKDAKGREIPLNTETLYTDSGPIFRVEKFEYVRSMGWYIYGYYEDETVHFAAMPSSLYLTTPDSWEKLEDDLDRCIEESDLCMYYNNQNPDCNKCTISGNESRGCTSVALEDIKRRIRKLRGEDDD